MKKKPAASKVPVLAQVCKLIPAGLVPKLARRHGLDKKARTFSPWSQVVALLYAQLTHAMGLNDVCDALRNHAGWLGSIRGATAPARNTLSHANKTRSSDFMEELFWKTLSHLEHQLPGFGLRYKGLPRRFRKAIHAIDSSTIALVANCMDWAKHRRRKAAAKLHLRLDLQSFLPGFAVIEEASHHDDTRAPALCAGLQAGEIALFDKAYVHFAHLFALTRRGVWRVTRAKDNMAYRVVKKLQAKPSGKILRDDLIVLKTKKSREQYPQRLRRVEMLVEIDGKEVLMVFITNHTAWAASSVGELYQARWGIEVFFKQIKQTLKVCDFLGHSKQAIRWQLWSALPLYVLLRYQSQLVDWSHSFVRLFAMIRGVVWDRVDLDELLRCYGTAGGGFRYRATPETSWLPGLAPPVHGTA
ncbi:MAG: IS4 family transposase [Cumulibacter sp.]